MNDKDHLVGQLTNYDDDAGCQYGCTFDAYLLPPGSPNCSEGALGRGQGAREGQRERRDGGAGCRQGGARVPYYHTAILLLYYHGQ